MEQVLAGEIVAELRAAGHRAYLVGGCVRDLLLDMVPKDFDVSTSAHPEEVLRLFPKANLVGAHFGVVIVQRNGVQVEVATFRRDGEYQDGRRPTSVSFESTPLEDVERRDFTINALMLDPETGEVLDLVGGRADLEAGIVRAVGEPRRRFREDRLRMLRAVRFAARLRFEIDPATMAAIRAEASSIRDVSAERVRDELSRILTEGGARRGFELLDEAGLLRHLLPEIAAMKGVEQPPEFHPEGDVWTHTLIMLEGLGKCPVTLALGVLLHDVGKPATFRVADRIRFDGHVEVGVRIAREILNRLRYSTEEIEQVILLVSNHMRFMDVARMRESTLKRFLRLPKFEEHLALHRLDCLSSHGHLNNYEFMQRRRQDTPAEEVRPKLLITGRDLIGEGYVPGPAFSRVLRVVEDAQLENGIATRKQALELARELFNGMIKAEQ